MTKSLPIAWVTGASRGLGAVIARDLATRGFHVVVHGRALSDALLHVVADIQRDGGTATALPCDVRDANAVEASARKIASIGDLRAVVHCASHYDHALIDALTPEMWNESIATNLTGAFNVLHAVMPRLCAARAGRIIMMGCVGAERVYAAKVSVPYRVAVSGVLSLVRAHAQVAMRDGVTINMIAPGFLENAQDTIDEALLPMGRKTKLEEVLPAIRFLLSDDAAHISGACLNVSGGYVR